VDKTQPLRGVRDRGKRQDLAGDPTHVTDTKAGSGSEGGGETSGDGQGSGSRNGIEPSIEVDDAGGSEGGKGDGQSQGGKNGCLHHIQFIIFLLQGEAKIGVVAKISAHGRRVDRFAAWMRDGSEDDGCAARRAGGMVGE
jgi:hypothetical protein